LSKARASKRFLVDAATGATIGEHPIDGHGGNRAYAKVLSILGDRIILHIENDDLTRLARQFLDFGDRVIANGTTGAEHFDFSGLAHFQSPRL
jgi:hypothetical protein